MTLALAAIALLGALNPGRIRSVLPERTGRDVALVAGAAVAAGGALAVAVLPPVLDAARISPATARMATGLVLAVIAAAELAGGTAEPVRPWSGWRAGLVPIALPGAFSPAVPLVLASLAIDRGVAIGLDASVAAGVVAAVVTLVGRRGHHGRVLLAVCAAAGLVGGIGLVMDGLFDI